MSTTKIQIRGDVAANWTSANPVLAEREMGLETDTNNLKVGNGFTSWNSLPYFIQSIDNIELTGGTNINIQNDFEINLDDSISLSTISGTSISSSSITTESISSDIILSGGTNLYSIFATPSDIPTVPTTYPYDLSVAASDETTAIEVGTDKVTFLSPRTFTLTGVTATLTTTGSTDSIVDINLNSSTVLPSPLTIPSGQYFSTTTTSVSAVTQYDKFTVDIDTAGTDATGLKIILLGYANL